MAAAAAAASPSLSPMTLAGGVGTPSSLSSEDDLSALYSPMSSSCSASSLCSDAW